MVACMHTITSAISDFAAVTELMRFKKASDDGRSELLWAPVTITGTGVSIIKLKAAEV